jgi:hypothetical protein
MAYALFIREIDLSAKFNRTIKRNSILISHSYYQNRFWQCIHCTLAVASWYRFTQILWVSINGLEWKSAGNRFQKWPDL